MKDDLPFTNYKDVVERLNHCIVKYKGIPYYVGRTEDMNVTLYEIPVTSPPVRFDVKANSKDLFTRNIDIGYVNWDFGAIYYTRMSLKQTKSAISSDLVGDFKHDGSFNAISKSGFLSVEFKNMLLNKYPSFKEVLTLLITDNFSQTSKAFDKSFAIRKSIFTKDDQKDLKCPLHLEMQGDVVGEIIKNNVVGYGVKLNEGYHDSFLSIKLAKLGVTIL